jgi:hypothetical protein
MTLPFLHDRLAQAMLLFTAIAGVWGLVLALRRRPVDGAYWGILASAELLFLAQALVGLALWLGGARPPRIIHLLYGAVSVLTLPGYYVLSRGRDDRRAALTYALLCLFLLGISLRGIGTGRP